MDENECAESDLGYVAKIALCKMLHNFVGETKIFGCTRRFALNLGETFFTTNAQTILSIMTQSSIKY